MSRRRERITRTTAGSGLRPGEDSSAPLHNVDTTREAAVYRLQASVLDWRTARREVLLPTVGEIFGFHWAATASSWAASSQ